MLGIFLIAESGPLGLFRFSALAGGSTSFAFSPRFLVSFRPAWLVVFCDGPGRPVVALTFFFFMACFRRGGPGLGAGEAGGEPA